MSNQDKPLVTFAVFAYNQEQFIRQAIAGAFSQTYEPLEIILSDDCSSDRTFEIMQDMSANYKGKHSVRIRRNTENLGLASHINEVMKESNGEIVTWLSGDDIPIPERTEKLIEPLLYDKKVIAAHSGLTRIDIDGKILGAMPHSQKIKCINLDFICRYGTPVVTQSFIFRKVVFDKYGDFNRDLTHEAKAMAFRLINLGSIVYLEKELTLYRIGSGISTYQGKDLFRCKYEEPLKVTNWDRTAYIQMIDDLKNSDMNIPDYYIDLINKRIKFFTNLYQINSGKKVFSSLFNNLILQPFDTRSLKAAIRYFSPDWLYSFYLN